MANHKSAVKAFATSQKRRARNTAIKSRYKNAIKKVEASVANNDSAAAREEMQSAESIVMKAAARNVIKANKASRLVSGMARKVKSIEAPYKA